MPLRLRWIVLGVVVVALLGVIGTVAVRGALDTPERQVARYLEATAAGHEAKALEAWQVFVGGVHPREELLRRRSTVTHDLASLGVGRSYTAERVEWWRTCCEPGPIAGQRNAGLARIHVSALDRAGQEHRLVFEVFVKKLAWWGDAGGDTVRDWSLYEVHAEGEPCVFPSTAYGCSR